MRPVRRRCRPRERPADERKGPLVVGKRTRHARARMCLMSSSCNLPQLFEGVAIPRALMSHATESCRSIEDGKRRGEGRKGLQQRPTCAWTPAPLDPTTFASPSMSTNLLSPSHMQSTHTHTPSTTSSRETPPNRGTTRTVFIACQQPVGSTQPKGVVATYEVARAVAAATTHCPRGTWGRHK